MTILETLASHHSVSDAVRSEESYKQGVFDFLKWLVESSDFWVYKNGMNVGEAEVLKALNSEDKSVLPSMDTIPTQIKENADLFIRWATINHVDHDKFHEHGKCEVYEALEAYKSHNTNLAGVLAAVNEVESADWKESWHVFLEDSL